MIKKISIIIFFLFSVISFSKEYNRIASGSPAITEILYELGLKDKIIAMDKNSDVKELDEMKIPKISFYQMNTESIFSLKADLIILSTFNKADREDFIQFMKEKGTDVIYISDIKTVEDIYKCIMEIGEKTERKPEAEKVISKMEKEINEVREISKNIKNKKKVYFEISPFPSMYTFGKNVFMNEMLEIAGVENIFNDKSGWFIPSLEVIAARNPDIIFTSTYQVDDPVKEIIDRGNWNIIKAVREGKIYPISKEAVRPSIKIIEVIKKIAEISYPEYYKEIEKIAVD
ncbi:MULTISPECIES: ABC transporter substrate-binding protein [Fusobacterium]|uniref:ABC transporter substrate-binding protein n=1 Tax=Fusobacterium TaxID=848 RepID=UPI001D0A2B27|nr:MULTISPECIES: ABC transporter substrate-binding protein [Fusobacterium]MCB8566501.1 ABC transporter substrate-binding protein [Fusobacterium ulcerans]MCB8650837.1 ABC transporter substrate-binding protein [Fusobacterium ulcerans]